MRAVIDTNTWFRALINPHGAPAKVLQAYRLGRFTVVASRQVLDELEDILTRPELVKKYRLPPEVLDLVTDLRRRADLVEISDTPQGCRDPKDDKFIETALNGHAECIVTTDKDILDDPALCERLARLGIQVMRPHMFLLEIGEP